MVESLKRIHVTFPMDVRLPVSLVYVEVAVCFMPIAPDDRLQRAVCPHELSILSLLEEARHKSFKYHEHQRSIEVPPNNRPFELTVNGTIRKISTSSRKNERTLASKVPHPTCLSWVVKKTAG